MSLEATLGQWLAAAGGAVGLTIIVSQAYHNYKVRQYERRQAEALERLAGVSYDE